VTPLNPCEKEQTDSVESLVDRQQHHDTDEHRYRLPGRKSDVVREPPSKHDAGDAEDNGQQRANAVSRELAYPNLCYL
jgi:hypothetical protein